MQLHHFTSHFAVGFAHLLQRLKNFCSTIWNMLIFPREEESLLPQQTCSTLAANSSHWSLSNVRAVLQFQWIRGHRDRNETFYFESPCNSPSGQKSFFLRCPLDLQSGVYFVQVTELKKYSLVSRRAFIVLFSLFCWHKKVRWQFLYSLPVTISEQHFSSSDCGYIS